MFDTDKSAFAHMNLIITHDRRIREGCLELKAAYTSSSALDQGSLQLEAFSYDENDHYDNLNQ